MNLISPDQLAEEGFDKFRTNLGAAIQFLKHQHDENMDWIENEHRLSCIDRATAEFIKTTTGVTRAYAFCFNNYFTSRYGVYTEFGTASQFLTYTSVFYQISTPLIT